MSGLLAGFLFLMVCIRHIIAVKLPVSIDESYYFYWANNLQFSYFDHPPMIAWTMFPFRFLGYHPLAIRESSIILCLIISLIIWSWVKSLFGDSIAFKSVVLLNMVIPFAVGSLISTPDTPLLFFWLISLYCLDRALFDGKPFYWYLSGIGAGLGMLSKYNMILLPAGTFLFLVWHKQLRFWLKRREPYGAFGISFILFLPVIIWNYQHEWISFRYQFMHGFSSETGEITIRYIFTYIFQQMGMLSPFLFIGSVYSVIISFSKNDIRKKYLAWYPTMSFLFFGVCSLRDLPEANWPAFGYITVIILFCSIFGDSTASGFKKVYWYTTVVSSSILVLIMYVQPFWKVVPISPDMDPTNRLLIGEYLSREVDTCREEFPMGTVLITDTPQLVATLHYFLPDHPVVYERKESHRFPWIDLSDRNNKNALVVTATRQDRERTRFRFRPYFREFRFVRRIPIYMDDCEIDSFDVYYGTGFQAVDNIFYVQVLSFMNL